MQPLVVVTRTNQIESVHNGIVCVVNEAGHVSYSLGDVTRKVFMRSSAKPFLAVMAVYSGATDYYRITPEELAVICSSHSGEEIHRQTVKSILDKIRLEEKHLECGIANPYNEDTNKWLIRHNQRPTPLYNCCSGKHAGMLMLCKFLNYPLENYIAPNHPVQQLIYSTLAELLSCKPETITRGSDGCGVPCYMVTVQQGAYLYSLLAGAQTNSRYGQALSRIRKAMLENPVMINGHGEFGTELMQYCNEKIIGKVGDEGVFGVSLSKQKTGIYMKITDGNERAVYPVIIHLLQQLGLLKHPVPALNKWAYPTNKDHKGNILGYILPIFDITLKQKTGLSPFNNDVNLSQVLSLQEYASSQQVLSWNNEYKNPQATRGH